MKKQVNLAISIIIGIIIFGYVLSRVGIENIAKVLKSINLFYLLLYFVFTSCEPFAAALRWRMIIKAYNKKTSFFMLVRQTIACFAISYLTPCAKIGGEPLKAFMFKKEAKVDMRTSATTVIIDKFIEFAGSILFGIIGLGLIVYTPRFSMPTKIILGFLVALSIAILFWFYYGIISKKGAFSYLFNLFRLNKRKKLKKFGESLISVENKIERFFVHHKKEFWLACLFYFPYGIALIFATKFLLLGFGFNASLKMIILVLIVLGIANFIPVPAALGVLEAGQSSLFSITQKNASLGFAFSLIERLRNILFVALGLGIISHFSGKQLVKKRKV